MLEVVMIVGVVKVIELLWVVGVVGMVEVSILVGVLPQIALLTCFHVYVCKSMLCAFVNTPTFIDTVLILELGC